MFPKIAVGGTSCGGLESIANLAADADRQLTTALLFNTGGLAEPATLNFRVPTLWIGGGPMDVAYKATQASFAWLKKNKPELPTWKVVIMPVDKSCSNEGREILKPAILAASKPPEVVFMRRRRCIG
jgi:hypothetical protein